MSNNYIVVDRPIEAALTFGDPFPHSRTMPRVEAIRTAVAAKSLTPDRSIQIIEVDTGKVLNVERRDNNVFFVSLDATNKC